MDEKYFIFKETKLYVLTESLFLDVGDHVSRDEPLVVFETDKVWFEPYYFGKYLTLLKVDVTVNSPESGKIVEQYAKEGDTVEVGQDLYKVELGEAPEGPGNFL